MSLAAKSDATGRTRTTVKDAQGGQSPSAERDKSTRTTGSSPSIDRPATADNLDTVYRGRPLREWIALLHDENGQTRRTAATTIGGIGADAAQAVPALIGTLQDPEDDVRSRSAWALGRIGPGAKSAVAPLTSGLKDPRDFVQSAAATALGRIGSDARDAVPALVETLKDKGLGVRCAAIEALGRIGPDAKAAVSPLAAMFADGQNVRDRASRCVWGSAMRPYASGWSIEAPGSACTA